MRKFSQDSYRVKRHNQIPPSHGGGRQSREKSLRHSERAANANSKPFFERPTWRSSRESYADDGYLDLVPNYIQPALPYYVVPVLYVPDEEISQPHSHRKSGKKSFASYVCQTNQQRRIMLEDFDMPRYSSKVDPLSNSFVILPEYYVSSLSMNRNDFEDGDCIYEEETVDDEGAMEEDEWEEIDEAEYESVRNSEYTESATSVREEGRAFTEPITYEEIDKYNCPKDCVYVNHEYFPPNRRGANGMPSISAKHGGNGSYYDQSNSPSRTRACNVHPLCENRPLYQQDQRTESPWKRFAGAGQYNFKPTGLSDRISEIWPETDEEQVPTSNKRPTCEDILRNYMKEKHASSESLHESFASTMSTLNTPPRREETEISRDEVYVEKEEFATSEEVRNPNDNRSKDKVPEKDEWDSPLANFIKSLSLTLVAAENSSEINALKSVLSKSKSSSGREEGSDVVACKSKLDTKSTQTIGSLATRASSGTQTEQASQTSAAEEIDQNKAVPSSRESCGTLPDVDVFKPPPKSRSSSPATFFQFRKQSKPCAAVDPSNERRHGGNLNANHQQRMTAMMPSLNAKLKSKQDKKN